MKRSGAGSFQDFYQLLQTVHQIPRVDVLLGYTDIHGDLLPINNDDNYHKALSSANPLLRVIIQKKGKRGTGCEMNHIPQYYWFHLWTVPAGPGWSHTLQPLLWRLDVEMEALGGCQNPARAVATTQALPGSPGHLPQPSPMRPGEQRQILAIHPFEVVFPSQTSVGSQITPMLLL